MRNTNRTDILRVARTSSETAKQLTASVNTSDNFERFHYIPVGLFASVMGLSGLSIAWQLAANLYGAPKAIADGTAILAGLAFVAIFVAYLIKTVMAPKAVRTEFCDPIVGNLFGTMLISLLLLPILLAPTSPLVAQSIWIIGSVSMFAFAWLTIDRWMSNRQDRAHATPAWVIPVVGLLDIPLAYPVLIFPPPQIMMIACVAVGLFFAVPIFTMVFSRLLFESPLPNELQPTLFILVAPFAVGFSAYVAVSGQVDLFAKGLYGVMVFMLIILLGRLRLLIQHSPFQTAWWAVSFPIAASAGAAIRLAIAEPSTITNLVALILLGLATITISILLIRTALGILREKLPKRGAEKLPPLAKTK